MLLANMPSFLPIVNKARKPKFELHLTIYDLNNVPLVSGTSLIKWHLPHSMHGEHRGRTPKCPIDSISHRASYGYSKVVPLRITIDRNNNLTECPIEFEVTQEFPIVPGGRDEKMTLGIVKLNLSEYVEESENFSRRSIGGRVGLSLDYAREKIVGGRRLSTASQHMPGNISPTNTTSRGFSEQATSEEEVAEEGIVRRYLMQESKINSTLKIGILMIQIDGERNYVAPPLKTAPMFGGIAGIMAGDTVEPVDDAALGMGAVPNVTSATKSRDASELQDMYRRALAASWSCQPGELPADECIEDIFAGGDGWKGPRRGDKADRGREGDHRDASTASSNSGDEAAGGTLRPNDSKHMRAHMHRRQRSAASGKSNLTVTGRNGATRDPWSNGNGEHSRHKGHTRQHSREDSLVPPQSGFEHASGMRSRSESLASLAPTLGSLTDRDMGRGREGFMRPREVDEFEVREDLVSWALPGTMA
ncbi:N-terminal C2 in EEIG1 and EHBP1 proteins-domain-containing protein [Pseudomassariella vexata]|uniref:N-terminal C2 in EEIG1 and EHBP1 proteins-domain-containing protein n=1 Tax=Pseudomassariella vexata TaxID=1141098 RepID=A0A1Y2E7Y3_9PEZI|nr:N-terminal C2 in EEIG1 and EHBP1 proteins-domain-containing protein [Pseudomassariella vexata]ORY67652.1 N-terminal C2 in EEIG1 and EHBP1 proteins-domain-containing protein [Pseudomassariella vexata]